MKDAGQLLSTAAATLIERAKERDTEKERAMAKTVAFYNLMFPNTPMTEDQGWAFMVFLKLARSSQGNFREDDYIDMASYVALWQECLALMRCHSRTESAVTGAEWKTILMNLNRLPQMGTTERQEFVNNLPWDRFSMDEVLTLAKDYNVLSSDRTA